MNTVFDFAPLWRSGIGFDHLTDLLGQAAQVDQTDKYPPYDIEKTGEDAYRLTLALAGWKPDEIRLITEPIVLVVAGQKADPRFTDWILSRLSGVHRMGHLGGAHTTHPRCGHPQES